ncbi:MAG TPA: YihY/virulence factor BrkB family protein [Streptosporangiaceae bacterium]
MIPLVSWVQRAGGAAQGRAAATLGAARRRWRWFDHLARAYQRYQDSRGDRLAASMTYFGFLSFFPLLALAYALLGYVVGVSDKARAYLVDAINSVLPGLAERLPVEQIAQAKAAAGLIGLVGLLITGLGWMDAARESLRQIWGTDPRGGNFFVNKLVDVGLLAFLGAILVLSAVVSGTAIHATHAVLRLLGLADVLGMGTALWVLSLCVACVFDAVAFLVVFSRVSGTRAPWRRIIRGAVFGAVGFELLKLVATLLVEHTTRNPVYASFAVVAGLLVWIDIVSRFFLFTAAWTATRRVILRADATDATIPAAALPSPVDRADQPRPAAR